MADKGGQHPANKRHNTDSATEHGKHNNISNAVRVHTTIEQQQQHELMTTKQTNKQQQQQ